MLVEQVEQWFRYAILTSGISAIVYGLMNI